MELKMERFGCFTRGKYMLPKVGDSFTSGLCGCPFTRATQALLDREGWSKSLRCRGSTHSVRNEKDGKKRGELLLRKLLYKRLRETHQRRTKKRLWRGRMRRYRPGKRDLYRYL